MQDQGEGEDTFPLWGIIAVIVGLGGVGAWGRGCTTPISPDPNPARARRLPLAVEDTHRFQLAFWTRSPDEVSFSEAREIQPDEQSPFTRAADVIPEHPPALRADGDLLL